MTTNSINFDTLMNNFMNMMFFTIMMVVVLKAVAEPEKPKYPELPPGYIPIPGARPMLTGERVREEYRKRALVKEKVVSTGMTTTEIESKKAALEEQGKQMALKANEEFPERQVKFVELGGDWATRFGITRYWFEDAEGNRIVATDLDELRWKLSVTRG
jgi:hypothetical protein